MRENGDQSSSHLKTRRSETPAVLSYDEIQVKEEEFESLFSTSPIHFDNLGDDDSGDHPLQTSETTPSLHPPTTSRLPSHLDNVDVTEVQKLLKRNAELDRRLKDEKTARDELVSENDKLHKTQLQLQEQNSKLRATLKDLQEQYEEKCRQLRECEMQHSRHPQQERVKQEHVDDNAAELPQPLQLQAGQHRENVAIASAMAVADVLSDDRVKQEALVGDEADDREGIKSTDGEDDEDENYKDVSGSENVSSICEEEEEDGSGSEEQDSDERSSKR
jgi:spore coat protein CotF